MTIQIWRCPHLRTDIIDVLNWAGGTFSNQVGTGQAYLADPLGIWGLRKGFPQKREQIEG